MTRAKLLVTGFGPFPGVPENPTDALMRSLAVEPPETFGVGAIRAVVLPTDYRRSWAKLRRIYSSFAPDIVVHFGLSVRTQAIHLERAGRNAVDASKADAGGYAPASGRLFRQGPDILASTFPAEAILSHLTQAGLPAALSEDAGEYVCNATLYRSLRAAPAGRIVGLVHVPPASHLAKDRLITAARIILAGALGRSP